MCCVIKIKKRENKMMKIVARGTLLDTAAAKLVAVVYQNDDASETHVKLYRKEFDAAAKTDALAYDDMIAGVAEGAKVPGVDGNEDYELAEPTAVDFTRIRVVPGTEAEKFNVFAQMRYTVAA